MEGLIEIDPVFENIGRMLEHETPPDPEPLSPEE